jgi:hypothetical protein
LTTCEGLDQLIGKLFYPNSDPMYNRYEKIFFKVIEPSIFILHTRDKTQWHIPIHPDEIVSTELGFYQKGEGFYGHRHISNSWCDPKVDHIHALYSTIQSMKYAIYGKWTNVHCGLIDEDLFI